MRGLVVVVVLVALVYAAVPTGAQETDASLHDDRFRVAGLAVRGSEEIDGLIADWESPLGVLFYFFSPNNPEVMMKVLDTRRTNDHWNLYVGSLSDLPVGFLIVRPDVSHTRYDWAVLIGPRNQVLAGGRDGTRVHCALPVHRLLNGDGRCSILEFGQSAIVKFAWDRSLRIPSRYQSNFTQLDGVWSLPLPESLIEEIANSPALEALREWKAQHLER